MLAAIEVEHQHERLRALWRYAHAEACYFCIPNLHLLLGMGEASDVHIGRRTHLELRTRRLEDLGVLEGY